jgi:alpha-amylase/alpha-mannosidase (GH57 family)
MGLILERHPDMHATVNFVPSLVKQIGDLAAGRIEDAFFVISKRDPASLDTEDKAFILANFFALNWNSMVRRYPRYEALLELRGRMIKDARAKRRSMSEQELRDLQVLFNLAWMHPLDVERDGFLRELGEKGRNFTEEEKHGLLELHVQRLGEVIPLYRRLAERGQIELTTTPYYHPILPLLVNWDSAREAMPGTPMPGTWDEVPEDASEQVRRAVEYHAEVFGKHPRGMWPAEGSVSQEMIPLVADAGLEWLATDEDILSASGGHWRGRGGYRKMQEPDEFYQPFYVEEGGRKLSVVFRDRYISDAIGFEYRRIPATDAVDDISGYLGAITRQGRAGHHLVPVILDGENAWEYFPDQGVAFLDAFYSMLESGKPARSTTVSDYLAEHPPRERLDRLFAGSWIGANFAIWAGHDEDRRGWERLFETRRHLQSVDKEGRADAETLSRAWEELYIAEGSDWFWWYGDDRSSEYDLEFDRLFRQHLKNVYILLGDEPPWLLNEPIASGARRILFSEPTGFISVKVDGKVTSFFEWLGAGVYNALENRGAMAPGQDVIKEVHFGFDLERFVLRVDFVKDYRHFLDEENSLFILEFVKPHPLVVKGARGSTATIIEREDGEHIAGEAILGDIFEISVPFHELGFEPGIEASFYVIIRSGEREIEKAPLVTPISFVVPDELYEEERWTL